MIVFGGEVIASAVNGDARGETRATRASGDFSGAGVAGLTVLGQPVAVGANARVALADWGYLITLEQGADTSSSAGGAQGYHGFVTALAIHLTAPHGGLPAGSVIRGRLRGGKRAGERRAAAEAGRSGADEEAKAPARQTRQRSGPRPVAAPGRAYRPPAEAHGGGLRLPGLRACSYSNTYGAFRGDVAGNWHHGDDIFAPLGAPILACADGVVFSVGWNDVGGNRLWLRDSQGNEFYYAHLSAFYAACEERLPREGRRGGRLRRQHR